MLEQERAFYEEHLPEWLDRYPGKFVLVKSAKLVGVFDTDAAALKEGARQFGLNSFLVRRVEPQQQEVTVPALTLGLLHANPAHPTHGSGSGA